MSNLPQAVMGFAATASRFMNEFYPVVEQRGVVNVYMPREPINCVFDDDFTTYREYYVPQHGGQEPTPAALQSLRESMDKAYAKFKHVGRARRRGGRWHAVDLQGTGLPCGRHA